MLEKTKKDCRILEEQTPRIETGNLRFGNDWTGVFIRGDEANHLSFELRSLMEKFDKDLNVFEKSSLNTIISLLEDTNENKEN